MLLMSLLALAMLAFNRPALAEQASPQAPEAMCPVGGQCFADVPPGSPFYEYANNLYMQDIISGYPCGGPGEPCDDQNRPYYRPGNSVTRAQMTKFVDLARTLPGISIDTSTHTQPLFSRSTAAGGAGVTGQSNAGRGVVGISSSGYGVYAQSTTGTGLIGYSYTGTGVHGKVDSNVSGATGVFGEVDHTGAGANSAGVLGRNRGTGGNGDGVWGRHDGAGSGVRGTSTNGYGGVFTSTTYRGAYVQGASDRYSLYVDGQAYLANSLSVATNAYVYGDLIVSGTCQGCTGAYAARNAGDESISRGDLVAAAGVEMDPQTGQPVLLVRRAGHAGPVLGVAGSVLVRDTAGEHAREAKQPLVPAKGAAAPNAHLEVIVSGLAQVRVSTPDLAIGEWLEAGAGGRAARLDATGVIGRAVSTPDANSLVWAIVSVTP